ncbi:MAG: hypothetical protein ABI824_06040 [Acidobacteriota bacterium]
MLVNTLFEAGVEKLFDIAKRFSSALEAVGLPFRVIGGFAVFLHIDPIDPLAARLTRDVDVAIDRRYLDRIRQAVEPHGFSYRHVAGVDMFLDAESKSARSAVHLVFVNEKVRPEYLEAIPASEPVRTKEGILIAPVKDLVLMKLTTFCLKDKVHIQDMDGVGLITPEIEAGLSDALRVRLAEVRATE